MKGPEIRLPEAGRVSVTVPIDNHYDALRPDAGFAKRYRTPPVKSV
ncbi:MAG: hypothetical protein JW793_13690 [Acidobacteria bacterium]|nr:hypothetical protein [Acidobacteriota bacterium]